jgi:RNA polymerase sigma factor (sigma-70 family)
MTEPRLAKRTSHPVKNSLFVARSVSPVSLLPPGVGISPAKSLPEQAVRFPCANPVMTSSRFHLKLRGSACGNRCGPARTGPQNVRAAYGRGIEMVLSQSSSKASMIASMNPPPAGLWVAGLAAWEGALTRGVATWRNALPRVRLIDGGLAILRAGRRMETTGVSLEAVYRANEPLLRAIAARKFHVPPEDVAGVVHDVFVSYLQHHERVANTRSWLVGATCNRARMYWRQRYRDGVVPEESGTEECEAPTDCFGEANRRIDIASMLVQLPERCRQLLRMRFADDASAEEIATELDTTVGYARKLVHGCIAAARRYFGRTAATQ